jgi:hypothetical protein
MEAIQIREDLTGNLKEERPEKGTTLLARDVVKVTEKLMYTTLDLEDYLTLQRNLIPSVIWFVYVKLVIEKKTQNFKINLSDS